MRIESAVPEDCRTVAEVHVAAWQRAYAGIVPADFLSALSVDRRAALWRQVLDEAQSELLVAWDGGKALGFVSFGPSRDADAPERRGEIWAIYVSPDAWSSGVGAALWQAARDRMREQGHRNISLWVIENNERAIRFYRCAGFQVEPGSEKEFELGGATLREVRMLFENP
jgi:ribosomal protein S18 acetylase RimI-like enzyme